MNSDNVGIWRWYGFGGRGGWEALPRVRKPAWLALLAADRPDARQVLNVLSCPEVIAVVQAAEVLLARRSRAVALCPKYDEPASA